MRIKWKELTWLEAQCVSPDALARENAILKVSVVLDTVTDAMRK